MAFNPNIKYNPALSVEENLKATMNWLDFVLREMTVGRVPLASEEVDKMAERVTTTEVALAESDEIAIELYEANLAQEAINAEQDEAIIEIYEKMKGVNNG